MIAEINGVKLYYQKIGNGEPIILLHGHHLDGEMFNKLVAPLSVSYTVYNLDLRGHGLSSGEPSVHYQTYVDDLYAFVHHLKIEHPYVYGFDAGGMVALMLASQVPDLFQKIVVAGVFLKGNGIHSYHYMTEGFLRIAGRDRDSRLELTENYMDQVTLAKISAPTLCVVGEKDWVKVEHVRWYSGLIPNGRLILMPRQTHTSYTVNSFKMLDLLKSFFKADAQ